MDKCKNNINGYCRMFGRRANCEECSEYSCEAEENQRVNKEEAKEMTLQEAYEGMVKKLNEEYL